MKNAMLEVKSTLFFLDSEDYFALKSTGLNVTF